MTGYRQRRWVWKMGVGLAVLLSSTASARAFYWVGWPGAGSPVPPRIVSEQVRVDHRDPTPITRPGGDPWRPPRDDEPDTPGGVPEPATVVLAGIGLAVAGVIRRRRKKVG